MKYLALLLFFISVIAVAENVVWRDRNGNPAPNTDAMKSIRGFGGWLVVTPDKKWENKWNTPSDNVPYFREAKDVAYGEELTILVFFANAKADEKGYLDVSCDIKVTRPDGTSSIDQKAIKCAYWPAPTESHKYNVQLTQTIIKYIGEHSDLPGKWTVYVKLIDNHAGIEIPLQVEFLLKNR